MAKSAEDVLNVATIDVHRKKRIQVSLRQEDGELVPLEQVISKLIDYIDSKSGDKQENQFKQQVLPLVAQGLVVVLDKILGREMSATLMAQLPIRESYIMAVATGFLLMKFLTGKNIKIHTVEEDLTDEQIDQYFRVDTVSSIAQISRMMGVDPKAVIRELVKQGKMTREDLTQLGIEDLVMTEDETNEKVPDGAN